MAKWDDPKPPSIDQHPDGKIAIRTVQDWNVTVEASIDIGSREIWLEIGGHTGDNGGTVSDWAILSAKEARALAESLLKLAAGSPE